ncbi:hypothetical protein ACMAZF_04950 [Psychrobium sp. nBUS_13]|uniref:hypothetical protein n=1 Tax=Psychrobium sp. nBUS_13 TaxID=3395319 RepID=UPI003EBF08B3
MPLFMVMMLTRFFGANRSWKEGLEIKTDVATANNKMSPFVALLLVYSAISKLYSQESTLAPKTF